MANKRVVLSLPDDIVEFIQSNSTERTRSAFVDSILRKAMRNEQDGDGVLERLALAMEKASRAMEQGQ